ncbi:MAG: hypothetical protein WAL63_02230 [Solirubrobacteraceae bacterium]
MSRWPDLQPEARLRPWPVPLFSALVGGLIGWALALAGLGLWGLAIGAGITMVILLAVSRRDRSREISVLLVYGIAFVLLSWPVLWLPVGLVRYWISGQPLGD